MRVYTLHPTCLARSHTEAPGNPPSLLPTRPGGYRRLELGKHPHPRWGQQVCYGAGAWYPVQGNIGEDDGMVGAGELSDLGPEDPTIPTTTPTLAE